MKKQVHISINDLRVGYGSTVLFDRLNLNLNAGELVCFMGPNGSGKSSLIRILAGLQRPLSGQVQIESTKGDILTMQKEIALVLTDPVRDVNMTVEEVVSFGRYPYIGWNVSLSAQDRMLIDEAIRQVNITHLKPRKLHELSDGQLQMTMIARALAQDTPIIILDEPTAHLDLNNRVEIMRLLHTLAKSQGKAVLLATHELDLALQTADLIWLTGKNKDLITGIPEELVLNGVFDEVFEFKGFDLKTGKVQHQAFRKLAVQIHGDGYTYLWTRSALERNGFNVATDAEIRITIEKDENNPCWHVSNGHSFFSLRELISHLLSLAEKL